jgi:hypothetical protein
MRLKRLGLWPRGRAITVLVTALALGGCGSAAAPGPSGKDPCSEDLVNDALVDPVAPCREAMQLADAELGLIHAPVSRVRVRSDMCPPNARCALSDLRNVHWVIYEFWFGAPRMVYVGPPDQVDDQSKLLDARAPEPLPEWLLDELGLRGEG